MTKRFLVAALVGLFLLPLSQLNAQVVGFRYRVTPKPGNGPAFENAMRAHAAFRSANGDTWQWVVYQVVAGEQLGDYLVISNGHSYADMDAYETEPFQGLLGGHFGSTVTPLIESIGLRFNIQDTLINRPLPDGAQANLLPVTRYYTTPSGGPAFDESLRLIHEAIVANDFPAYYTVNRPSMGGRAGIVNIVGLSENWAGLATPDPNVVQMMISHYGQERATEIFESFLTSD